MFSLKLYLFTKIFSFYQVAEINNAACKIAREVADEGDALVAGGISQTPAYLSGLGKEAVQKEFKKQIDCFVANNVDFLIAEVCWYIIIIKILHVMLIVDNVKFKLPILHFTVF